MKYALLVLSFTFYTLTGMSAPVKVKFTYAQEGVTILNNDLVFKDCPEEVKVDFELGGKLIFFKPGFESQLVKISKDSAFTSYRVNLHPLANKFEKANVKADLKKTVFVSFVTNFSPEEVTEIIKSKLNECNVVTSSANAVFTNATTTAPRYSIGMEVTKSLSKNGSYSAPYYLFSYHKIKWLVMDNTTNQLVLELPTEGFYLAYFKAKKGLVASTRLKEITVHALEEATQKFVNSPEFAAIMQ